ncbi:hypothetical protein Q8A67_020372 [Cirrhinus molitorella]|uniref:Uncharacterized protein n=1 Tax=Cirrhinus molitorella TaxID=172907 RepID=A0AA88TGX0_9TELE|nr:hypothetical protein Q8A67_020372 [Cirrhinus molitorella]
MLVLHTPHPPPTADLLVRPALGGSRRPGREAEDPPDTIPCGPSSSKALEYMAQLGLPSPINLSTKVIRRLPRPKAENQCKL